MTTSSAALQTTTTAQTPPVRLRGRDFARLAGVSRVLLPYALDRYGYAIRGSGPAWVRVRDQDREWYRYIVRRARLIGEAWPSYATMAADRECSIETAQRYMRRLAAMGLVEIRHAFAPKSGDFTSNRYRPIDPIAPEGAALAIQYRGRVQPLVQGVELPPIPEHQVRQGPPRAAREAEQQPPVPVVVLPHYYRQVAEAEGLYDLLEQSRAWDAFLRARRSGKIKRRENPNAYFRGIVRKLVEQARIAAAEAAEQAGQVPAQAMGPQQAVLPIVAITPADEAVRCRAFLEQEAQRFLAEGLSPFETVHRLLRHPQLARFTRIHALRVDEIDQMVAAIAPRAEALRAEAERRRQPVQISADAQGWLRRQYADLRQRRGSQTEQALFGAPTPAKIARMLAMHPGLHPELQGATPEQLEALLLRLETQG